MTLTWNQFIQSERLNKGQFMLTMEQSGFLPHKVVSQLYKNQIQQGGIKTLLGSKDKVLNLAGDETQEEILKRLTNIYSRNKKNWIKIYQESKLA